MALDAVSFDEAIKDAERFSKKHLVIGNGFSIAARPGIFTYGSLFQQSGIDGDERLSAAFEALKTTDFEEVIRALEVSAELVPIYVEEYEVVRQAMREDAARIKDILIETVANNHPDSPFDMTPEELQSCRAFLANFISSKNAGKIFTVNYDLLLYWALMHSDGDEDRSALRVDDGFGNDDDDPDAEYVVWHGETRANTPSVYYLHGALHLFDNRGKLQKFTWVRTGERLKDQARSEMDAGKYPLFVSEGTTEQKFERVRHNAYLYQGLKTLYGNARQGRHCFFIHGHSLAENDNHIFSLIGRGTCRQLYVSVHGDINSEANGALVDNVRRIQSLRGEGPELSVTFYDASSAHVWDRYS